jgi:uncharacterized protein YggE
MNRRRFLATLGTGATLALAGCLSESNEIDPLGAATIGGAEDAAGSPTVHVAGVGEAEGEPDVARMQVAVEESGSDADAVRSGLAERSDALHEALVDAGVDEEGITTGRYDIRERRQGTGYEGVHAYDVEVDDVDAVGEVIDTAVDAGADDVGRIRFTLSDERRENVREDALTDAIEAARSEAETIAAAKDVELTGIVTVSTTGIDVRPRPATAPATDDVAEDAAAPTELREGPVSVTARVEVVYAIE